MLLSRYGNLDLLREGFIRGTNILYKAYEKMADDKLFLRWTTNYERHISFDEFKNRLRSDDRDPEEILSDVSKIIDGMVM